MDRAPRPAFPLDLRVLADEPVLQALTAAELGAVVRLACVAWSMEPPCSLPDDDLLLARWAGLTAAEWAAMRPAVERAFAPAPCNTEHAGRLVNDTLRRAFNEHALAKQVRTARARAGGRARHRPTGSRDRPPLRLARQLQASSELAPSKPQAGPGLAPPTPPSSQERPRPCALPEGAEIQCAQQEGAAEDARDGLGARARALIGDLRTERDRRRAGDMLRGAAFPWADPNKRKVHPTTIARLLDCRHAHRLLRESGELPLFVDYALSEIRGRAQRAADGGEPIRTPIGLLIAAFGAQETRPTTPWIVPLWHREDWDRREKQRAEAEDLRDRIARIREAKLAAGPTSGGNHSETA